MFGRILVADADADRWIFIVCGRRARACSSGLLASHRGRLLHEVVLGPASRVYQLHRDRDGRLIMQVRRSANALFHVFDHMRDNLDRLFIPGNISFFRCDMPPFCGPHHHGTGVGFKEGVA